MADVPAASALRTPVVAFTVALAGVLLLHVPPETLLPSDTVTPWQAEEAPVTGPGVTFTVTGLTA